MTREGEMIALIVNVVAALEALFYLCAIPVHLAVRLDGLRVAAGLSAFAGNAARRRAADGLSGGKKPGNAPDLRQVLRVLRRLDIERLELTGRASLGDAAATALLCGLIVGLARALGGRIDHVKADVRPDFRAQAVAVELQGMIRARSGKIILATLQIWTEEAFSWITTRLKTS